MHKSFEDWYTDTFGGRITKEQASDVEGIAYDYYVDNCRLTDEDVKSQKAKVVYELQIANLKAMLKTERELKCNDDFLKRIAELEAENENLGVTYEALKFHDEEEIAMLNSEIKVLVDLIKNIVRVTWGEGWNYSLDWKEKAEKFLEENK